jgi:hypothetical protein
MKLFSAYTTLLILALCIVSCSKEDDSLTKVGDPNSTAANQVNQNTNSGNNNPGGSNTAPATSNGKPTTGSGAGSGGNTTPTVVNPHGPGTAYASCSSCHNRVFKNDNWNVVPDVDNGTSGEVKKAARLAREIQLDEAR